MRKDGGGTGDTKRGGVWETSFRRVPLPLKRVPWPNSVSYKTQFTYQYMSPINSECKSYIVVWCWSRKPNNIVGGAALGIRRNKNTWTETGSKQEAVMCSKTSGKTNSKKKNMQIWSYTSAALLWHMTQLYNTSCSNLALQYIQKSLWRHAYICSRMSFRTVTNWLGTAGIWNYFSYCTSAICIEFLHG